MDPPLIGSKISLISKNEIRYEGILYDINKVDTTIALKDGASLAKILTRPMHRRREKAFKSDPLLPCALSHSDQLRDGGPRR